jgi:uncharacterized protein (UPF0335 family)
MADNLDNKGGGADEGASPDDSIIKAQMEDHGLAEKPGGGEGDEKPEAEKPAGDGKEKPTEGEPQKVTIGEKEYTADELSTEISSLKDQVKTLTGEDAKANKLMQTKMLEALERMGKPQEEVPVAPSPEEVAEWKQGVDKKMLEDPSGTVMDLAASVIKSQMKPIIDRLEKIEGVTKSIDDGIKKSTATNAQNKKAMDNIKTAFTTNKVEMTADVWGKAVKFYDEVLGVDLMASAYNNPEGLVKQLGAFLKNLKPGDIKPAGEGAPAGGGGAGSGEGSKTDIEKLDEKMAAFGFQEKQKT